MDNGWIKLHRKALDSGLMQNQDLWMFWCWCLLKATHKPCKVMVGWQMVELQPGQFVFGRKKAAAELPLTEQTIRTCLKKLENLQNLTIKPTNKFSIITIINWDTYQSTNQQDNQQNNQHVTSSQPAANHKQECKEYKETIYTPSFLKFWEAYPKKTGKGEAFKAWEKIKPPKPSADEIIRSVQHHNQTEQWRNKQYIPNPATFLNQRRWEDEVETAKIRKFRPI